MKTRYFPVCLPAVLLLLCLSLVAGAQTANRVIDTKSGVEIRWIADKGMFTPGDAAPLMSAKARSLKASQVDRALRVMRTGLAKYPPALLRKNLRTIYIVQDLSSENTMTRGFDNVETKRIYVNYQGDRTGFEREFLDADMEATLHLSLANLLTVNNPAKFPEPMWNQWAHLNKPGFRYGKRGRKGADKDDEDEMELSVWWKQGVANAYAAINLDTDVASTGELLFAGDADFWENLDQYAVLKKKTALLISFYHALDPVFTEAYFRQMAVPASAPADAAPPKTE